MTLRQDRILAGQCPACGKDAAPYRLCDDCRRLQSLRRLLNRAHRHGFLTKAKKGSTSLWSLTPDARSKRWTRVLGAYALPSWGEGLGDADKRTHPRLGGMRVDVEQTLVNILTTMGKPATLEEIQEAWGRLRGERKHLSLANDIAYIIESRRKRAAKEARRAQRAGEVFA